MPSQPSCCDLGYGTEAEIARAMQIIDTQRRERRTSMQMLETSGDAASSPLTSSSPTDGSNQLSYGGEFVGAAPDSVPIDAAQPPVLLPAVTMAVEEAVSLHMTTRAAPRLSLWESTA